MGAVFHGGGIERDDVPCGRRSAVGNSSRGTDKRQFRFGHLGREGAVVAQSATTPRRPARCATRGPGTVNPADGRPT